MKWLRLYSDVVSDPKVQRLPADKFKAWINLLCVACQHDGILPPLADLAFTLRIAEDKITTLLDDLVDKRLLDVTSDDRYLRQQEVDKVFWQWVLEDFHEVTRGFKAPWLEIDRYEKIRAVRCPLARRIAIDHFLECFLQAQRDRGALRSWVPFFASQGN
jgi:hypothetical protein